jgi:UDP-N-acetyl-2-amino-2-deoxyglucuronate dehydrogenase
MISVAIIGCGRIARDFHIPAITSTKNARVVALCDTNHVSLTRASRLSPKARLFESPDALMDSQPADVVDICTPGFTHFLLTTKALESGHHVIVEKPVALSLKDTLQIDKTMRKSGRQVCVVQSLRYHDNVQQLMRRLNGKQLGNVTKLSCIHHGRNLHNEASWLHNEDVSGGLVYEIAIHLIDLMAVLLGEPRELVGINVHHQPDLNLITGIETMVRFANGKMGYLDIAQDATLHSAIFTQASVYCTGADAFLKFGPDYIRISSGQVDPLQETVSETQRLVGFGFKIASRRYGVSRVGPHRAILQGFFRSIASGSEPPVPLASVFNTMRLADLVWNEAKRQTLEIPV